MEKFVQVAIVAGVVIKQDGKYLLIKENRPGTPVHGFWNFPAGKVDHGFTIEETAVKEAKEETGFDVTLVRKLGIFQLTPSEPPQHAFEAKITGGSLVWPKDEIQDAQWFTLNEIKDMKDTLRGEWVLGAITLLEK